MLVSLGRLLPHFLYDRIMTRMATTGGVAVLARRHCSPSACSQR